MPVDRPAASRNAGLWMDLDGTETREDQDEREFVCVGIDEPGCACSFRNPKRSIRCGITDRPSADCEYSRRAPASRPKSKHFADRSSRLPRGRARFSSVSPPEYARQFPGTFGTEVPPG